MESADLLSPESCEEYIIKTPIDMALEAQYVKRWSMVATNAESTVASHSFNVALIAMAILRKMYNTNHISIHELCYHAMLHDIGEVYTGDIPTPTKVNMRNLGFDPNDVSGSPVQEDTIPDRMAQIIKMADLIDNSIWIEVHGVGGRASAVAGEVSGRLSDAIAEADADLGRAAQEIIQYIKHRMSHEKIERECFAQNRQRLIPLAVPTFPHPHKLDREPLNGGRCP